MIRVPFSKSYWIESFNTFLVIKVSWVTWNQCQEKKQKFKILKYWTLPVSLRSSLIRYFRTHERRKRIAIRSWKSIRGHVSSSRAHWVLFWVSLILKLKIGFMVVVTARSGRLETRKVTSTPLLTVFSRPVFPEPRVLGINFVNRTGTGWLKYRLNLIVSRKIKLKAVIYLFNLPI